MTIDLQTAWGNHSLVTATRILMAAALEDPYNQQFQLVCEATISVRAPLVTHDQLLAQNMSRIGYPGKVRAPPQARNDCHRSARCLDPYSIMRSPVVVLGPHHWCRSVNLDCHKMPRAAMRAQLACAPSQAQGAISALATQ